MVIYEQYENRRRKCVKNRIFYKICRVITIILAVLIIFFSADFILSEITDKWAYEDCKNRGCQPIG